MEKIWLKNYPKGVPAEIDVNDYESIRDVFEESATKYATRPAFTCMGKSITFAELDPLSAAFGAYLQANGCKKGTRVALMMPNILQYPVCLFGTLRAGCTVVNVNPLYTARELEHQLNDSGAEVIVVVENFARTVAEVLGRTKVRQVIVTSIGELLGFKGIVVDLVLRRVKKMIPAWSMPEAVRLSDALAAGRAGKLERVPLDARRHRVPAVHGRHDGRGQGRGPAAPEHRRQPAAGARVAETLPEHASARSSSRRCRSITSSR